MAFSIEGMRDMSNITIKDIAKQCGVSVSTVSRAINNHPGINQATKDMILKVVRDNQFIPNNSARNLKRLESNAIVVLVKGIGNPFFQPMIDVLEKLIHKHKYTFILQRVNDDQDEIEVALEMILEKKPKGIIFLGGYFIHTKDKLRQLDLPCVIAAVGDIDGNSTEVCSAVHVDDVKESYRIVDYLCKAGHKRIALLAASKDDRSISALRLEGYRRALKDNGLEICDDLINYTAPEQDAYTFERGYKGMQELLAKHAECTAVFAIADVIAMGVCRALKEAGKNVPEDYSVVGFDGLDMSSYYIPTLTTVKQPVVAMAEAAAEILFDAIEENGPIVHQIFEGELLIRESSRDL